MNHQQQSTTSTPDVAATPDGVVDTLAATFEEFLWNLPDEKAVSALVVFRLELERQAIPVQKILAELSDEALALTIKQKPILYRSEAFEELLVRRYELSLRILWGKATGRGEGVEDFLQELYLKIFTQALHNYQPDKPFFGWLKSVAHNLAFDFLRKRMRRQGTVTLAESLQTAGRSLSPCEEASQRELQAQLDTAIRSLPEQEQRILQRSLDGLDAASVAAELCIPKTKVYRLLFQARRSVQRILVR